MKTLFSTNNLKTLHFKLFPVLAFLCLFQFPLLAQMGTLEVDPTISSGIITAIDANNEIGIVQFKIDHLDQDVYEIIVKEYAKYEGEIVNFGASIPDKKLIVSYRSPSYPNFLLAILDRVNIRAYYNANGTDVFYVKDGYSAFIR